MVISFFVSVLHFSEMLKGIKRGKWWIVVFLIPLSIFFSFLWSEEGNNARVRFLFYFLIFSMFSFLIVIVKDQ